MKRIVTIFMTLTTLIVFLTSCTGKCNPALNEDKRPVLEKVKGKSLVAENSLGGIYFYYDDEVAYVGQALKGENPTTGNIQPPNKYPGHPNAAKSILIGLYSVEKSFSKTFTLPLYAVNTQVAPDGTLKSVAITNDKVEIEMFVYEDPTTRTYGNTPHKKRRLTLTSSSTTSDVEVYIEIFNDTKNIYEPGPFPKLTLKPAKQF